MRVGSVPRLCLAEQAVKCSDGWIPGVFLTCKWTLISDRRDAWPDGTSEGLTTHGSRRRRAHTLSDDGAGAIRSASGPMSCLARISSGCLPLISLEVSGSASSIAHRTPREKGRTSGRISRRTCRTVSSGRHPRSQGHSLPRPCARCPDGVIDSHPHGSRAAPQPPPYHLCHYLPCRLSRRVQRTVSALASTPPRSA